MAIMEMLSAYAPTASLGLGLASGLVSMFGGNKAEKQKQQQLNQIMQMLADNKREIQQGYTDSEGNRVVFISGQGLTVIPKDFEKMWKKNQMEKDSVDMGSSAMNELKNTSDLTSDDIYNLILSANTKGINESSSNASDKALMQGNRTGANIGEIMTAFNSSKMKQMKDAIVDANLQSRLNKNKINYDRKAPLKQEVTDGFASYNNSLNNLSNQGGNIINGMSNVSSSMANVLGSSQPVQQDSFMQKFGQGLGSLGNALNTYSMSNKAEAREKELMEILRGKR